MESRNGAKWIWLPNFKDFDPVHPGAFVLFRKTFIIGEIPQTSSIIHVSADTRYRLFVNGNSVVVGPCKSYPSRWYYETVDISEYLRVGSNVIAARVLRFFPGQIGSSSLMQTSTPGFVLWGQIDAISLTSDETWLCCQDESVQLQPRSKWNYILGPPFLSLDENVDFSVAQTGWQSENANISGWSNAIASITPVKMMPALEPWKLYERPIPLLPETTQYFTAALRSSDPTTLGEWNSLVREQKPLSVAANQEIFVELEAATLTTGFLEFDFAGGHGTEITILCAESYERDLGVASAAFPLRRHKGDRRDFKNGRLYGTEDHLQLAMKDTKRTHYEPFWFRTFRFIRLSIICKEAPLLIQRVAYRETHYPLQITAKINLSPEYEQIWQMCLNTLRNCMHETYEDCPFYEQNQFAMDGRLQMLFTYQVSQDDRLARKTIHEFYASRRDDGLLETNFPVSFRAINIPQFSLFWIMMVYDHMMYFGDQSLVRRYIGTVDGILQHFDLLVNRDGLVGAFDAECWAFVDWVKEWQGSKGIRDMAVPPIYKRSGVATYNSLVYAWALEHAAQLCDSIGRHDTAVEYRVRSQALNAAVKRLCFNDEYFVDGPGTKEVCEHTQVFAVLSGAISGLAATELMQRVMNETNMVRCSYSMKHYLFRALEKTGLYEEYFDRMMEPWKQMVQDNLTTCAEDDVSFRSDCHGWSASPIYEFVAVLHGKRPTRSLTV